MKITRLFITLLIFLIVISLSINAGFWLGKNYKNNIVESSITIIKPRPLDKYTIENLSKAEIKEGEIEKVQTISEDLNYTSFLISFEFAPTPDGKELKKTTGMLTLPDGDGLFPLVLMLRGYVDQEIYKTGMGTERAAKVFAKNGFITIAPDFLGYAGSSKEADNIFEARFQTYTTVLSLIKSLKQPSFAASSAEVASATKAEKAMEGKWDNKNLFLWGHSNGGQIALTILEITGGQYPTTLWAPVSKPFPYSVLYYTDEAEDRGKFIRRELAKFEDLYDTDLYSIDKYFDKINASLQIHQGTADDAVPLNWSEDLVKTLEKLDKEAIYFTYTGADHNMKPSWNTVVNRDLSFFAKNTK